MVSVEFAGLTLHQPQMELIAAGAFGLALLLLWLRRFLVKRRLFKLCGVPTSSYRLLGTTLLGFGRPVKLRSHDLNGIPSTVFLKKNGKSAYVCHFNPRFFKGRVKVRERYQMLLFMGLVKERFRPEKVQGAICYQDHLEGIAFEPAIYQQLLDMRDEFSIAVDKWEAPNPRPLFNRNSN